MKAAPPFEEYPLDELERTRLIREISKLLTDKEIPESTRLAGLTLVGWLARRRLAETPHALGIAEARESERRLRAARCKAR
jgi:hypothetical protein